VIIMKLKKNVGTADKIVRYVISVLLVIGGVLLLETNLGLSIFMFVFAVVLTVTALVSFCGLYTLFGVSTCKLEEKK
jgi:multisubunit Na+/H+ antiporter MnhG subunit